MAQLFTNNAISLLAHGISDIATSLDLVPGTGFLFPNPGVGEFFLVTLEDQVAATREIIKVTGRVGDTLTFLLSDRGQEGTTIRQWLVTASNNVLVELRATAATMKKLAPAQVVRVSKDPGAGEFSSIAAALAAITDASASKIYQIRVEPGHYIEPQLISKSWVSVIGCGSDSTILEAANPNQHFVISTVNDGFHCLTLTGATGAGSALLYCNPGSTEQAASMFYDGLRFGNADILALVECTAAGQYSQIFVQDAKFGAPYQFNQGFISRSVTGGVARMLMRNTTTTGGMVAPYPTEHFISEGPGAEVRLIACQVRGAPGTPAPSSVCVSVTNGGFARVTATTLRSFGKAIHAKPGGAAPSLEVGSAAISNCVIDLHVEHSGTLGSFNGSADIDKVIVDPNSPISVAYNNIGAGGGYVQVGGLFLGNTHESVSDMADLIQRATPTGALSGGVTSKNLVTPLTVDVTGGYGYVEDAVYLDAKRVTWLSTTAIPVVDNTNNWIYVNNNGIVQSATSIPDTALNIILSRVRTAGGAVVFIALIPYDATRATQKQNDYLRNAIGPIFGTGCIVTESLTTPRTIDITDGQYWYGTNKYLPTGGLSKAFNTFYHTAGNWGQTNNVTTVDNSQYDDGNNLQPLTLGYFVKHAVYVSGDGVNESISLIYGRGQYATLLEAQNAPLPLQPGYFVDVATPIAALIVQQGVNSITQVVDIRPRVGFQAPSTTGAAHHGDLLGLDHDDHTQYLLVNGTRSMSGNLNLGTFSITNGVWAGSTISVARGGTGLTALGTANQIFGVNAGATAAEYKTITPTADQTTVTHGAGTITIGVPATFTSPGSVTATSNFVAGTATSTYTSALGIAINIIPGVAATATSQGNDIIIRGGPGGSTSGTGGDISIFGGIPTSGAGGSISIAAANAQGALGDGGNVNIAAGIAQGAGVPGKIQLFSSTLISAGTLTVSSLTANSFLYSGVAGLLTTTTAPTNGQLLIGSTGAAPVAATLNATVNQTTITNGAGSITVGLAANPIIPGTANVVPPSGTTAQRVAAVGGTRYNSTFNMLEYYNGAVWRLMAGVVIQKISGPVPAGTTAVAITPGNTAPLITDGTQVWTQSITPLVVTSTIDVRTSFIMDANANNKFIMMALFRGTTCIFTTMMFVATSGTGSQFSMNFTDSPAVTSAITYSMRAAIVTAGQAYWASNSAGNTFGGTLVGTYSLEEKT